MRGHRRAVIWDMRQPGEAFCAGCPDREACMGGWPCSLVRDADEKDRRRKASEVDD